MFNKTSIHKNIETVSLLRVIIGAIVFFIKKKFKRTYESIPLVISGYTLIKSIPKDIPFKNFSLGIYQKDNETVFIKTWQGKIKDLNYYSLVNEYYMNNFLYKKFLRMKGKINIRLPKVIAYDRTEQSFSVIFEYIEGDLLSRMSEHMQIKVITSIQKKLAVISASLTEEERRIFSKRTLAFYLFTLPFLSCFLMLTNRASTITLLQGIWKSFSEIMILAGKKLTIAHRDLTPINIICNKKNYYVIDTERMVLTLPFYDQLYLQMDPDFLNLKPLIEKSGSFGDNSFLKVYMAIHFAFSSGNITKRRKYYLSVIPSI